MKKEHFDIYKEMIMRCINSCVQPVQLIVCYDMMERFKLQFTSIVAAAELHAASEELLSNYAQMHHVLND